MENNFFGVMLDMSRNGVMKVDEIKKYASIIKKMGYNMLQLYMEDVYEVDDEPYFGYLRGRYSKEELKDIVSYCNSINIEVVPCIQTLAHLENLVRWAPYKGIVDFDNILLVDDPRTYELIENMFKSLRECFTTDNIHIGMDEAYMLGLGRYLELHGYQNRVDILSNHLQKVMKLCEKYNFKPMMWSDMFFRLANNGQYYPEEPATCSKTGLSEGIYCSSCKTWIQERYILNKTWHIDRTDDRICDNCGEPAINQSYYFRDVRTDPETESTVLYTEYAVQGLKHGP